MVILLPKTSNSVFRLTFNQYYFNFNQSISQMIRLLKGLGERFNFGRLVSLLCCKLVRISDVNLLLTVFNICHLKLGEMILLLVITEHTVQLLYNKQLTFSFIFERLSLCVPQTSFYSRCQEVSNFQDLWNVWSACQNRMSDNDYNGGYLRSTSKYCCKLETIHVLRTLTS